ncbi:long-chain-fatty-acid--CoA ligase 4 isoform X2 [Cylas formicarius]|nr:long-chain-fatty-acid--CoA ligase 4 isoform X2 [Cylas formicarius]XP_060516845.1 long-chain-fatty-acid--CoA ligase 4 isoform X2 [Cylas formicarius]XP_060516846.1 long-chain-fatty-acid--CoA ligase 4 isoform X2 [Cylas formicarius]
MDSIGFTLALGALRALAFVYDVLTFPVYVILQRPWRARQQSRKIKAVIVASEREQRKSDVSVDMKGIETDITNRFVEPSNNNQAQPITQDTKSITYRSTEQPKNYHIMLLREKVDTMAKLLELVSKKYPNKRCLGTRQIFGEDDEVQPNGRVFKKFNMGDYRWKTFSEVNTLATNFGKGLRELGNHPGENVVIFAETRAEWLVAAHGLFKQNIPLVTIYATLGEEAIAHGINETDVTTVVTSYELMPKFKKILPMVPKVKTLIYMEDQLHELDTSGYQDDITIIKFTDVLEKGAKSDAVAAPPNPTDTAIIMYTSGSTGVPKGVIILHKNLIATLKAFCDSVDIYENDVMIGFLPLAHVFELLVETVCLCAGVPIGYSSALTMIDSSSKIKKGTKGDASVLQPTCMTCVPLILDRISKSIQENVSKASSFKKLLFKFAYDYKVKWRKRGYETPLVNKVVFSAVRRLMGGSMRLIISGGAPLSPETHEQVNTCLCVTIIQGYGLTESTSSACVQDITDMTFGRVGAPVTICEVKIVNWEEGNYRVTDKPYPRGEIVIGGDNITAGYYKLPEKSKEDFYEENGKRWFKTGDVVEVHDDGVVKIIDRKKDLVKLQAGEYVSLGKVESQLKTCPLVDNICVYGEPTQHYCVALVVPNQNNLVELAKKIGLAEKPFEELCENADMEKAVCKELAEHGLKGKLAKFEIPAAVKLVAEVWSPDMGLVTAAFKLKRKDIQERYQCELRRMYAS